jgi:magnesium transporter
MTVSILIHQPGRESSESFDSLAALSSIPEGAVVWVDIETEDPDELQVLSKRFGLHELAIEDCLTPGHFPKIEDYGDHVFFVLRALKPWSVVEDIWEALASQLQEKDETIQRLAQKIKENAEEGRLTRKVSIFLANNFIITHRRREISWLDAVVRQITQSPERYLHLGTDVLAHRIIDVLTDRFHRGVDFFDNVIESSEDAIVEDPQKFDMGQILALKRALVWLRQIVRDQRGVIARLAADPSLPIAKQRRRYFRDTEDQVRNISNIIEKQIDSMNGVRDSHFAEVNLRLNDTMRILAIITTIAAPLNIVVGMYGMNFEHTPLLHHPAGFWYTVVAMLAIVAVMLVYFRRKKWL